MLVGLGAAAAWAGAADAPVALPDVAVYSPRVANQAPAGTFAMPVSALRFEPLLDLQARNLAEAQADITIRGGIFESTGFGVGAVSLGDPQTGHYSAEIPIAPAMLSVPAILTGAKHAMAGLNATAGTISYGWRPVENAGLLTVGAGEERLNRQEIYQGGVRDLGGSNRRLGADIALARSESDGAVPFGDSKLCRLNGRLQLTGGNTQTDVFAGYQAKFFGWPNLYTPFNSNETENLQTLLFAVNHRTDWTGGDYAELGAYHRRNKDDYAFNRAAAVGAVHPFQHTTWMEGAAVALRKEFGTLKWNLRAETARDRLQSTSLISGGYKSRDMTKITLVPEGAWDLGDGTDVVLKAGGSWDTADHGGSAISPVLEVARESGAQAIQRLYFSLSGASQLPSYTALKSSATAGLFRGNAKLGRSTSRNFEIGAKGLIEGWTAQAALFHRRDNALVDWTFRQGVTARTANPVDIATTGFEVIALRSWSALDLVLGYTALTKDADYRGAPVDASFYALNFARQRLTAALTLRLGHGVDLRLDHVARVQQANPLRTIGGNRAIMGSFGLNWRPSGMRRVEFSLRVENLWDTAYQEVPAVPAAPRQISGGVSCVW